MRKEQTIVIAMILALVISIMLVTSQPPIDNIFINDYGTDYGIVLSLDLEEGTGSTTYDQSPYGNDGTITGAAWASGKYGMALTFDGNDYVTVSDSTSLDLSSNITIEAWAKDPPIPWGAELGGDFEIIGNAVIVNDTRAYLSAEPHTLGSSGWVTFTLVSKQYSGLIDVVWGFNRTETRPRNPQIWANYSHTLYNWVEVEKPYTNETGTYFYETWDKEYYESWFYDWKPLNRDFTKKLIDAKDMDTWYILKKVDVKDGEEYRLRIWVDLPFKGTDLIKGKYAWGIKLSSDTIQQAIESDRFYFMDPWYNSAWLYRTSITIDSGDIGETLTDFPVMVYLDDTRIIWAHVQNDLDDLRFTSSDGETLLAYEIEDYTTNVDAWLWVQIPNVSGTTDTEFFMYYGNDVAANGEDKQGTWDTNYVMVQHMVDETTSTILDSTQYDNDGAKKGANEPIETAGKIDSAQEFDGVDDYITVPHAAILDLTTIGTIEFWVSLRELDEQQDLVFKEDSYGVDLRGADNKIWVRKWEPTLEGTSSDAFVGGDLNEWFYIVGVFDRVTNNKISIYVNGAFVNDVAMTDDIAPSGRDLDLGSLRAGTAFEFNGSLDEIRISDVVRSVAWITAEYESQTDDLLTFDSETSLGKIIVSKQNAYMFGIWDTSTLVGVINSTESRATITDVTEWHYYAMTYDGSNIRLYIDGALVKTTSCTGSIALNDNDILIGERFLGEIDQARIYGECKTLSELKNQYINSKGSYSRSVVVSDNFRILNSTLSEEYGFRENGADFNQNYILTSPTMFEYLSSLTPGRTNVEISHSPSGLFTQDIYYSFGMLHVDIPPGDGKWVNVTISNGIDSLSFSITGDETNSTDMTGFLWDVSEQPLVIQYTQSTGGTSRAGYIHGERWYVVTP